MASALTVARGARRPNGGGGATGTRRDSAERALRCKGRRKWRDFDGSKRAEMRNFYHRLWFWDGDDRPVGSFCRKLFLLEAGGARFHERLASAASADC